MRELSQMLTVEEVDEFIEEICRNSPPELLARAESRKWNTEERTADAKLDAVCKALERRAELASEPVIIFRSLDGFSSVST